MGSYFARIMRTQTSFSACQSRVESFFRCLDENSDGIGACQETFESLEDCTVAKLHNVMNGVLEKEEEEEKARMEAAKAKEEGEEEDKDENKKEEDDDDDDDEDEPAEWAKTMASMTGGERIWGEAEIKRSSLGDFFVSLAPKIFENDDDDDEDDD